MEYQEGTNSAVLLMITSGRVDIYKQCDRKRVATQITQKLIKITIVNV